MLGTLSQEWAPDAFIVSFKLETKDELLEPKALSSMNAYGQHIVIGNLLRNHQDQVILYKKMDHNKRYADQRKKRKLTLISKLGSFPQSQVCTTNLFTNNF